MIGGAIGGLILLIFVITVIVVVSVTLVRRRGSSHNLKRMQSKDKDISKIQSLSLASMLSAWINNIISCFSILLYSVSMKIGHYTEVDNLFKMLNTLEISIVL